MQGDYPEGQSLYEESLAIYREFGDKPGTFWALNGLGWAAELQGDYEAARGFFDERLTIAREIGSQRFVALSLWRLGDVAWAQGEYEAAHERYEESRALGRQVENQWLVSEVLLQDCSSVRAILLEMEVLCSMTNEQRFVVLGY